MTGQCPDPEPELVSKYRIISVSPTVKARFDQYQAGLAEDYGRRVTQTEALEHLLADPGRLSQ